MRQGQKLTTDTGIQVALFPIDVMYITQGEYGSLSHTLAMDFVGWSDTQGQIPHYPYYAPVDMTCVDSNTSQAWYVWQSDEEVLHADGTIDYLTMVVMHDDNPPYTVGDKVKQGDLLGRSGSSGYATGDHIHLNTAKGQYAGWTTGYSFNELLNSSHLYDSLYNNDTYMTSEALSYGYNWREYQGGVVPPTPEDKKKLRKFPWFIYYQKRRNLRRY